MREKQKTLQPKRLCIYFFYDPDGIVDDYVLDCLQEMAKHVDKILVVSNVPLQPEAKARLKTIGHLQVTERPNVGFDVWAYKHGIETIGWRKLTKYDEVIFMNFTIVGPVYPFKEMFDTMAVREVDFWGINIHAGEPFDPWGLMPEGFIPKHLQSHFIAVRKPMLKSKHLQDYWKHMRPIQSYQEAICYHEAIFTPTFANLGFAWDSYIPSEDLDALTSYPLMFMPREIIQNRRCPIFKRKALLLPMHEYIGATMGQTVIETLDCLKELGYDLSRVMSNILRTGNQYDIRLALNATHILSESQIATATKKPAVAIVAYVDSPRKAQLLERYLPDMRASGDVFIVVGGRPPAKLLERLPNGDHLTVKRGNRLTFIRSIQHASERYDVLGILGFHSAPPSHIGLSEIEFYRYGLDALFGSRQLIANAVDYLANSNLYSALAAPQTMQLGYAAESEQWEEYCRRTQRFLQAIGVHVPMQAAKPPLSSASGTFWIKSAALGPLCRPDVSDALQKLKPADVERVFGFALPFIVQAQGSLMSYAMSQGIAENHLSLLTYLNSESARPKLSAPLFARPSVGYLYLMKDGQLDETTKIMLQPHRVEGQDSVHFEAVIPYDSTFMRFDPVEGFGLIAKGMRVEINGVPRGAQPLNAVRYGDRNDIFITSDPQYTIEGEVAKGDRLTITFDMLECYSQLDFAEHPETIHNKYGGPLQTALTDMQQYYDQQQAQNEQKEKRQ